MLIGDFQVQEKKDLQHFLKILLAAEFSLKHK